MNRIQPKAEKRMKEERLESSKQMLLALLSPASKRPHLGVGPAHY